MTKKVLIQINNGSFSYPGEQPLFEDLKLTITEGEVTALVGINGSGKSTLLQVLAGKLQLTEGSIEMNCKSYYVPQVDLMIQNTSLSIYEYISNYYEAWWEIPNETERLFGLVIDVEAETRSLSGGELMKLNLAIALKNNPDLLILDEPTNHLDVRSINNLIEFIKESSSKDLTFLIVSHDVYFLDSVITRVLNLENKEITSYGGNYSFYKEQKELHLRGAKKKFDLAVQKLESAEALAEKTYEKQQRKIEKTKRDIEAGKERDKYIIGSKKDSGGLTEKSTKTTLNRIQNEISEKIEEFEPQEDRKLAFLHLKNTQDPADRVIFEINKADLLVNEKTLIKDIEWKVLYGDRVVIAGDNGSGKTSLIKALLKLGNVNSKDTVLGDAILKGATNVNKSLNWVYIDQNYSSVDPDLSLVENLMAYNSSYTEDKAKEQLGKFQFKGPNEMSKLGKNLSGGETVRLIMSMITASPIDLIILDEPTNNLDVETVEVLVKALNKFRGAIIVISHNIEFLNAINIRSSYLIKNEKMKHMKVDPSSREAYIKELLH